MLKTQAEDIMNVWNVLYKVRLSAISVRDSWAVAARGGVRAGCNASGANPCGTPIDGG